MSDTPTPLPEEEDPELILSTASLVSIKAASPIYTAENAGLSREVRRREQAGLDARAQRNRLAVSQERLTLYNSEIALASKIGEIPEGAMVIVGVVTRKGEPVEGLIISAYDLDGQPVPPAVETGPDGSFVLTIRKQRDVRLVVSTADLELLHCHDITYEFEEGITHRVRIDLETTEPVPIDPVYPCSDDGEEEDQTTVPDLTGMSRDEADATLERAGLKGIYQTEQSPEKAGTVIAQSPPPGTTVDFGTAVSVTLAEPQREIVPDVVGRPRSAAEGELQPRFSVEVIMTRDGNMPGRVVRQVPAGGTEVVLPATVTIFVGEEEEEPELIDVPDVVGMSQEEGQSAVEKAGFVLGGVKTRESDAEQGVILSQDPEAGTARPAGSPVSIVIAMPPVNDEPDGVMMPDVVGRPAETGQQIVNRAGFRNVTLTLRASREQSGTIILQSPPAGTLQPPGVQVTLVVARNADMPLEPIDPREPGDDPLRGRLIAMPSLAGANLSDATVSLQENDVAEPQIIFEGQSHAFQIRDQQPAAGARIRNREGVVLTASVPNTWRRDPALAVSNLYRLHPAMAGAGVTKRQNEMIARKLSQMSLEDIEAMIRQGEDGVAETLTRAQRVDKAGLARAISFAVATVRENMKDTDGE